MAITVLHSGQTGSTATATLVITSATQGNILVMFINERTGTTAPTGKDNLGTAGWTVDATNALSDSSNDSIWVAYKTAAGGETELEPTAGAGSIQGIAYFELENCSTTIDTLVEAGNSGSTTTVTSPSYTTSNSGSIILGGCGGHTTSGTIDAWEGTGPVLTNIATTTSLMFAGYNVPGTTESGVTAEAHWATASASRGLIVVAFEPSISAVTHGNMFLVMG